MGTLITVILWLRALPILLIFAFTTVLAVPAGTKPDLLDQADAFARIGRRQQDGPGPPGDMQAVEELVARYAPLLYLHPNEIWWPGDVESFIQGANIMDDEGIVRRLNNSLPTGPQTKNYYILTDLPQGLGTPSVQRPPVLRGAASTDRAPVYVTVSRCPDTLATNDLAAPQDPGPPSFHATYWTFHPFNQGKFARGKWRGNHVGDWEHVSIRVHSGRLTDVYISSHDFGAYYAYSPANNTLNFVRQNSRGTFSFWPTYPQTIEMDGSHPVLYVALGSHGIWPTPGKHVYLPLVAPHLADVTARGPVWRTWRHLVHLYRQQPHWLQYRGRWGNPRNCLSFIPAYCPVTDGPPGIARRKTAFQCGAPRPQPARSLWQRWFGKRRRRRAARSSRTLRSEH